MNSGMMSLAAIAAGVIGLAILAVLVSKNANTTGVIQAASTGFASVLGAAEAPIGGSGTGGLLSNSAGTWT